MDNEAFEKFDKERFGKKDMPINYEKFEAPLIGVRYVDAFVQSRFEYYQAAQQQSAGEIAELKQMYRGAKILLDFNTQKNPLLKEIAALTADNERLREALEKAYEKLKLHVSGTREYVGGTPTQILFPLIEQTLSATRTQSLQAHDEELIERCADICYASYRETDDLRDLSLADSIMELKGKQ
jgi:hypothetical protein